jgi:acyl-coenzyme A synthetase/AMP-(fatty) acid ligase
MLHCSRRLESFMVPKEVEFTDSLPKTSSGKIARKEIQKGWAKPSVDGAAME